MISGIRGIAAEAGGGQPFIERILQPAAAIFDDILKRGTPARRIRADLVASLTYLGWLQGTATGCRRPCCGGSARARTPAELAWFLGALDRLAYGLRILGHGTKRRASRFGAVVHAIRNGRDLQGRRRARSTSRARSCAPSTTTCATCTRAARRWPSWCCCASTIRWPAARRDVPFEDLTVEHVLPRKPGTNSPWRGCFPDPAERDQYTESLGNLVLVTKAQNDKAGNLDFARKKEVLFKAAGAPTLPRQRLRAPADGVEVAADQGARSRAAAPSR